MIPERTPHPPPPTPFSSPPQNPLLNQQGATLRPGDYALVSVHDTSGITLRGSAVARTTLGEYASAFDLGGEREKAVAMAATAATSTRGVAAAAAEEEDDGGGSATAAADSPAGERAFV